MSSAAWAEARTGLPIRWQAPPECREDMFRERLGARQTHEGIDVSIDRSETSFSGSVRIGKKTRSVTATTCDELIASLALVANLWLDDAIDDGPKVPVPAPVAPLPDAPQPTAPAPYRPAVFYAIGPTLGGGVTLDRADPIPAFDVGVFGMLGVVGSSIASGGAANIRARFQSVSSGPYRASLVWVTASESVCMFAWARSPLRVGGCALIELGAIHGTVQGANEAENRLRFWGAAGPEVRAVWVPARSGSSPLVGLRASMLVPWVRDRFLVENGPMLFQAAPIQPEFGMFLGFAWQ